MVNVIYMPKNMCVKLIKWLAFKFDQWVLEGFYFMIKIIEN
ncbi:hypothetical protein AO377_1677 [Moraxella catarrhalis]|nr:hypothetical protein AO381_0361 [Moraxella catarrhalis]OAV08479.1 hypothetical protein AO377_1677 [Moraxella catarrhalis]OAV18654.1 hypothetical protein AO375_0111 [Moraxella catarrhalis]OAV29172.1 hypothetical protein AO368_1096 [Moraxella catarrhalis]OAV34104.1 hypothetical protein AO365_1324 [Moraxella catarrhalis]